MDDGHPSKASSPKIDKLRAWRLDIIQAWKRFFGSSELQTQPRDRRTQCQQTMISRPVRSYLVDGAHTNEVAIKERTASSRVVDPHHLGRYAQENQMPNWLVTLLAKGDIRHDGIIIALGRLLGRNSSTEMAYLCHWDLQFVSKLKGEGGFCGYRNIQTIMSYIIRTQTPGWEQLGHDPPGIFQIQDLIETAWDLGYNIEGRVETGGIRGTRKYIGTSEVQALFCSLGFVCSVQAFKDVDSPGQAACQLLNAIEGYFKQCSPDDGTTKVRCTSLPPIYLQQPGHSITIVGLERQNDGQLHLLVCDPSLRAPNSIIKLANKVIQPEISAINKVLQPYRRSTSHLRNFNEFEVLYLHEHKVR